MGIFSASGDYAHAGKKLNTYNLMMILFVSLGSLCYGYTANVISATLAQPTFTTYFALDTRADGLALLSATNGIFQTGGVLGTLSLSWFSDKWGRKGGLLVVGSSCHQSRANADRVAPHRALSSSSSPVPFSPEAQISLLSSSSASSLEPEPS